MGYLIHMVPLHPCAAPASGGPSVDHAIDDDAPPTNDPLLPAAAPTDLSVLVEETWPELFE